MEDIKKLAISEFKGKPVRAAAAVDKNKEEEEDEFWAEVAAAGINDIFFPHYPHLLLQRMEQLLEPPSSSSSSSSSSSTYPPDPLTWDSLIYKASEILNYEIPEFDTTSSSISIEKGKLMDVESLLCSGDRDYLVRSSSSRSNNNNNNNCCDRQTRLRVESLKGKYVMVCCFYVPLCWDHPFVHEIVAAASLELKMDSSRGCTVLPLRDGQAYDFEIVVVPKMRRRFDNIDKAQSQQAEAFFDHFISAFPNCLVVPFWDKQGRDFICKSLNLNHWGVAGLVLDPNQTVVVTNVVFLSDIGLNYAFPFDDASMDSFRFGKTCGPNPSLELLLDCKHTDTLYKNATPPLINGGRRRRQVESVSISHLREKVVGLFLCPDILLIHNIDLIHRVHQQCKHQGLDFEIVLVCSPYYFIKSIQDCIFRALEKRNISWWVFPFNNSVTLRLKSFSQCSPPALIIVGPRGGYVDYYGLDIMTDFGVYAYPFTREALFQKELKRLMDLTVDSLLEGSNPNDYLLHHRRGSVHLSAFPRKNVAVYVGHLSRPLDLLEGLVEWYPRIKENYCCDFEVVFVCLSTISSSKDVEKLVDVMPWYVCPFEPQHSAAVQQKLFGYRCYQKNAFIPETIISFGEDGRICSTAAQTQLFMKGPSASPFYNFHGDLRKELKESLEVASSDFSIWHDVRQLSNVC